jgi:hypothetical protein
MMRTDQDYLNSARLIGDSDADAIIEQIFSKHQQGKLYHLLQLPDRDIASESASSIKEFIVSPRPMPTWYDTNIIGEGQRFFKKYALEIMSLLGALSLPYCYAATPGNKAIYLTQKMRTNAGKRLVDTAEFIITVMQEKCFEERGLGYIQINKTRLIHALVRHHIQAKGEWNINWGLPVNQEDMAGTNLAFSFIILVGLRQTKYPITEKDAAAFLNVWRFIGYQLHIDEALLPADFTEAKLLEQTIRDRHFNPSAEGKLLTDDLINHYKSAFPTFPAYFVDAQIRYLVGPEVSQLLGLKPEKFKDAFTAMVNKIKERLNQKVINPYSYSIMIKNHHRLKQKYQA